MSSPLTCTVDFTAPGKQLGRLELPTSTNTSAWAQQHIPIACISRGVAGPTALVLGGNHGDEYEGQVVALKLLRELEPEHVTGRVIVLPCLSPEASKAGTRLWPDGANFNRSFPGRSDGPPTEQLAHFVSTVLFPLADYVIDIHSGGTSQAFVPCSHMHVVHDRGQRRAMLDAMLAWGTDHHFLYIADVAGSGLLPVEAARQGKVVVTTELGGGGAVWARIHRLAERGLANVLRHAGILGGEVERRSRPGVILDGRDPRNYLYAPVSGIFETLVDPGDVVSAGEVVGRIHSLELPERDAAVVQAPLDGVTVSIRAITPTRQGDNVLVFGQPIAPAALLAEA
jgi:N-alpha-acetyl-L-2,4-diaminobutyrate deacetylase